MRKIPILPTIVVIAAVATMIALGVWQLQRKAWKEG
ncbi:MAG: SURF1 family protein, partial [Betaproteobacteria bacterium]|nr:SURF1 family protein [Betaproteobacteria bacterium]